MKRSDDKSDDSRPSSTGDIIGKIRTSTTYPPVVSIEGRWNTSLKEMKLYRTGQKINGAYDTDGGKVFGELKGSVLYGYWTENDSNQKCSHSINGNYHWGRIKFVFRNDKFTGAWGYCDEEPDHSWMGTKIHEN